MKFEVKSELTLAWIVLILGGVFQIGWSIGVDYTEKFTVWYWDLITIFFLALSMVCMEWPMRHGIAFTTAYAVWIGVGVSLTVIVSAILGLDSLTWLSALFMVIVIAGVVGLKATPVEYLDEKRDEGGKEEAKEERSIHTETHFNPPQGRRRRSPAHPCIRASASRSSRGFTGWYVQPALLDMENRLRLYSVFIHMYSKILVAVDGSEENKPAVDTAVKLAKDQGAVLCAMCVFDIGSYAALTYELAEEKDHMMELADEALQYVMAEAKAAGVELVTKVAIGKPAESLITETANHELVICGTHGRTGLQRAMIGSVAEKIVRASACPVLVVRSAGE